ncbi:retrotransposon protein, putative, ty3-gypsy subclass, partial [Tanacetum coccineum]
MVSELQMPPCHNRVNNKADPAFTAAVAQAVANLRGNPRGSRNGGDAQPTDIHVWLERFRKEKPQTFSSASTPVEAKNWIAHIEKIFKVLGYDDQFKARILNTEFTDVAQVANAARNIEIFRDRSKNEGNNKRDRDGHRIRPSKTPSHRSNKRAYDRRDNDRYDNGRRYRNIDRRGTGTQRAWRDWDQQVWGQQYGRSYGSSSQRGYSDYTSSSPCNTCGKFHLGKACHRATGACYECGEVGHLAKDCKKGSTSTEGNRNNKPHTTRGKFFALTTDQVANAPCTISGTLYMYDREVFVLFDTDATHSVVSLAFSKHIKVPYTLLYFAVSISTPMRNNVVISHEFRNCPLRFNDKVRSANLLPLEMSDFDIILGMDWLTKHRATIDCYSKRVIFGDLNNP